MLNNDEEPPPLGLERLDQTILQEVISKGYQVSVENDIDECEKLWRKFSSQETIFETWEFRYSFWAGYKYELFFIVISKGGENLGLLALWYEADRKWFYQFGSWWQEEEKVMVKEDWLVDALLKLCPRPTKLIAVREETYNRSSLKNNFIPDDSKYILDLKKYPTLDAVLDNLKKKKRYNLKRDRRIIESQNPKIIWNRFEDLDHLIRLSKYRLREKGSEADWEDPRQEESFRKVLEFGKIHKSYDVRMLTVEIDGKVAGVDLILLHNNIYAPIKCGYDVDNFPGVGNFVNLYEIEDALAGGFEKIDFLAVNNGWKDTWLEEVPLYVFEK